MVRLSFLALVLANSALSLFAAWQGIAAIARADGTIGAVMGAVLLVIVAPVVAVSAAPAFVVSRRSPQALDSAAVFAALVGLTPWAIGATVWWRNFQG